MDIEPSEYSVSDAPLEMREAAARYESRFGVTFATLTHFPASLLKTLHAVAQDATQVHGKVTIASRSASKSHAILEQMAILTRVANTPNPSKSDRDAYVGALTITLDMLPSRPDHLIGQDGTLCIGIEREGRILAQQMGWLPSENFAAFHAKRIPHGGGLLVGLSEFPPLKAHARCVIVDGAIASGATIISVLKKLRGRINEVHIYSVHTTFEGIRSIMRFAAPHGPYPGMNVELTVGHATAGINPKFYAINPKDPRKALIGDVGDTIDDTVIPLHT